MSQQYPNQSHPPQAGYGAPAPQPAKKRGFAKTAGLGCAGILALLVVIGIAVSANESGNSESTDTPAAAGADAGTKPADGKQTDEREAVEPQGPVKISAKETAFSGTLLADDGDYTSVLVTIENDGDESIDVNPLYFSITDTNSTKHTAELAVDEKQIGTANLAPGENISGTVTGKGAFTPEYVTYTDGLLGDPVRADVS